MKLGKNINGSRECLTTFLDGNDSITRSLEHVFHKMAFAGCTNIITSFLEDVRNQALIRIYGKVKERTQMDFVPH
jgi:hypothetical protein